MIDTATLLLIQTALQAVLFIAAAVVAVQAFRRLYGYLKAASEAEGDAAPAFPATGLILRTALTVVLLMAAFATNVWMPKNDPSAPAVNSTMQGQIYRDADTPVVVVPAAGSEQDHKVREERREELIDDVRKGFEALPDDE